MYMDVTIFTEDRWRVALAIIKQGFSFLDSILLFDTDHVRLSFLGFLIAVFVFFLVWDSCSLWDIGGDYDADKLNHYINASDFGEDDD